MKRLTVHELWKAQGFIVTSPAGIYPERTWEGLSPATRERLAKAAERFGEPSMPSLLGCTKRRIRLRMVVKAGAHIGYQQLNPDNTIHSYEWFEEN